MPTLDNTSLAWIIGIVAAVVVVALIIWYAVSRRHTRSLRDQYGPEYNRTVRELGTRRGEQELLRRQKRVDNLDILPLSAEQRNRFSRQWLGIQAMFVDDPGGAVTDADRMVEEVMKVRGYPLADFDRRAADLSVHHGPFVENYRAARDIAELHRQRKATTEALRRALIYYRALFEDLLEERETTSVERAVERPVERDALPAKPEPVVEEGGTIRRDEDVRP